MEMKKNFTRLYTYKPLLTYSQHYSDLYTQFLAPCTQVPKSKSVNYDTHVQEPLIWGFGSALGNVSELWYQYTLLASLRHAESSSSTPYFFPSSS